MEREALPRSRMSLWQSIAAIAWIPVHVLGLPLLLFWLFPDLGDTDLNLWIYVIGLAVLLPLCLSFLRRDFDRVWERPGHILAQALIGLGLMLVCNILVGYLFYFLLPEANPNDEAVDELLRAEPGKIGAVTLVMAPLLEELMFRGGVFGTLRRWNRAAAYIGCLLLFALLHTWQYALYDPKYLLFILQYLPAGWLLCRCYEKTECIWASILLHVMNNSFALLLLTGRV